MRDPLFYVKMLTSAYGLLFHFSAANGQQHPHHHSQLYHQSEHHFESHVRENVQSYLANMPSEPEAAIRYIFDKLNSAEMRDAGRGVELTLKVVDVMPGNDLIDIRPQFTGDHRLRMEVTLKKSLLNNPVYLLEFMSSISEMIKGLSSYNVLTPHNYVYFSHDYHYHHHHQKYIVVGGKHYHVKTHIISTAFEALGIVMPPSHQDSKPFMVAELNVNAHQGSAYAARQLIQQDLSSVRIATNSFPKFRFLKDLSEEQKKEFLAELAKERKISIQKESSSTNLAVEYFTKQLETLEQKKVAVEHRAQAQYSRERAYFNDPQRRSLMDLMEREPQKLNDLLKANDREGVARLLETFIPLAVMEPLEKGLWQDWIEAIRRPRPENGMLMFRGLDAENDRPQVVLDAQGRETGHGFFSTLLNRNQGSFTRRLRSVATMRYRFQNGEMAQKTPVESTPLISHMMINHSGNPMGSPVMSFTTDIEVATSFGRSYGVIAAKIDSRRVLPNIVSGYTNELELLVPLLVFPDEIVHFEKAVDTVVKDYQGKESISKIVSKELLIENLNKKLGHPYTQDISKQPRDVFLRAYEVFADAGGGPGSCQRVFLR